MTAERAFTYVGYPARVRFAPGAFASVGEEAERLGLRRLIVLSTPAQAALAEAAAARLGATAAGSFAQAEMHTPLAVTERAMAAVAEAAADGVVAVGGGSTIGLAKAIALRTGLPQIVVPTTYAGSEMTPIVGETGDAGKVTCVTPDVLPEVVIYDVELTLGLPPGLSATSGLNAIAHAAEALYARDRNPVIRLLAIEGARALAGALPAIIAEPGDRAARGEALYGAWLCGTCLGAVGMSLHHKLCHVLGGTFDLPHAETHAALLPHALAYNREAAPEAMADLGDALGAADAPAAIFALAGRLGAPRALRDLGLREGDLDRVADQAVANPYWNPRPLDPAALRRTLQRAWAGEPPDAP